MKKILEYLSYLFVFLLPWQTRWIFNDVQINDGVWEYGRMSLYSFDVVFFLLFIFYCLDIFLSKWKKISIFNFQFPRPHRFVKHGGQANKLQITNYKLLIAFFVIFIFINIFLAENRVLTLYWWLRVGEVLMLGWWMKMFGFLENVEKKIKTALAFVLSVTFSAILGIYQFLSQNIFACKWFGLASQGADDLGVSVIQLETGQRILRAYGSMSHPNILAGFIVVALLILVVFWEWYKIKYESIKIIKQSKFFLLLYYFIILLLVAGLFFTFSRAGWLAMLVIIIGYIIYYIYQNKIRNKKLEIRKYEIVVILVIWGILCFLYWPLVQMRLGLSKIPARLETMAVAERVGGYGEAWQVFKKNPVVGVGLGNYTRVLQKIEPGLPGFKYQPVHNVFLLTVVELGMVGGLGILGLVFLVWKGKKIDLFLCVMGLVIFIFLCTDHFWWTSASGLAVMILGLKILSEINKK